jgi:hypothetical protein
MDMRVDDRNIWHLAHLPPGPLPRREGVTQCECRGLSFIAMPTPEDACDVSPHLYPPE